MALPSPTLLAQLASIAVALLAGIMAYLGWRSYRATENPRLVFVVVAFLIFVLKGLFISYNVSTHLVPHDGIEFVSSLFDLIIVVLMFVPFFVRSG